MMADLLGILIAIIVSVVVDININVVAININSINSINKECSASSLSCATPPVAIACDTSGSRYRHAVFIAVGGPSWHACWGLWVCGRGCLCRPNLLNARLGNTVKQDKTCTDHAHTTTQHTHT